MIELVKIVLVPSGLSSLLILVGLGSFAITRVRRVGFGILTTGAVIYLAFSSGSVASLLIGPLESYDNWSPAIVQQPTPSTAVVLTAYANADLSWPLSSRPGASTLYRIVEAATLYKRFDLERLVISGEQTSSRVIAELLVELDVPESRIVIDRAADDTSDSALNLGKLMSDEPFLLVTSAGHMPRARLVLEAQGLEPVPVPTDFQMPDTPWLSNVLPSAYNLYVSDLAVREYAALAWYRLTGKTETLW